ncbi:MAG TPA: hypothetical protein VEB43_03975 [Anaeromyxobacter sp.]|nr:hypothetical protein [Anaeromyxobacter sp.]
MPTPRPARLAPALALVALLACLAAPAAAAAQGGPVPLFTAYCNIKGAVPLEVTVNGATTDRSSGQEQVAAHLNTWLRAGKNELRFRTPPGAKLAKGATVTCEVVRSIPRKPPIETTLATFTWPAAGAKAPGRLDRTLELAVPAEDAPPCTLWGRAEKLTLDGPTRAAVLKVVSDFEAALRTGDVKRVLELQRFSSEDWVRCNGKDLEEFRKWAPEQARAIVEVLKAKRFQWSPARAKVELVADGRLAQVTVNGGPAIVVLGEAKDDRSTFAPFVARIDGAFVLVR